jgi:hypothetical protein
MQKTFKTFAILHSREGEIHPVYHEDPVVPVHYEEKLVGHCFLGEYMDCNVAFLFLDYSLPIRLDLENEEKFYLVCEVIHQKGLFYKKLSRVSIQRKEPFPYAEPIGCLI